MTPIQKKCIRHAIDLLSKYDTYEIYKAVSGSLDQTTLEPQAQRVVTQMLQDAQSKQGNKIREAMEWLETLLVESA